MSVACESSRRTAGRTGGARLGLVIPLDALLVAVCLALAAARLAGGHGYGTYKPRGMALLEGWPASWEAFYFLEHLPTFLGDVPSRLGIAPVDYRTYVNLYLFTQLFGWTGSAYWSLAAVDLSMWIAAALCVARIGLRLGLGVAGAYAGALLAAASPIFFTQMWHQDMHLANVASLPLGLWAALALIQERRSRIALSAALSGVLLYLSLTYQYQWFVAPVALVVMAFDRSLGARGAAAITGGAVALFLVGTAALRAALSFSGLGPLPERLEAVQQPLALVTDRIAAVTDLGSLLSELPGPAHVGWTATAYHPLVYALGLAGLAALGARGAALTGLAFALPLVFARLYPVPWVAMTAYPLLYLGAGHACALIGRAGRGRGRIALALAAAAALCALTNGDLWGDYRFLLAWWNVYSAAPLY